MKGDDKMRKNEDFLLDSHADFASAGLMTDPELYTRLNVKRGLRDLNGKGVLTGLTNISEVVAKKVVDGEEKPCHGKLYYRGIDVNDIVNGFLSENRAGFEETVYLLIFGHLPTKEQYDDFRSLMASYQQLPEDFIRSTILSSPSKDMMNALSKGVLTLYSYDDAADDVSIKNVIRQCLQLISRFPGLCVYAYHAYRHYHKQKSLVIHNPDPKLSISENTLRMLRPNKEYSPLEARILDLALVLHAEHGGGNNSTFTTHVVTSSGTDTYSSTVASLGSLKGPRHGGANIKVVRMFDDMKKTVENVHDDGQICDYLNKLLNKEAFDGSGLIYGVGHAVYSLSDPRAVIFKKYVRQLAEEKGLLEDFDMYERTERLAPEVISAHRKMYKGVSVNVDFYSGFVYRMLGLPEELFTPLFAIGRIAGWSAHRIEEIVNNGKIIRPAYQSIAPHREYVAMSDR